MISQRKNVIALLIVVVLPLFGLMLARTFGIRLPSNTDSTFGIFLMAVGAFGIVSAVLLKCRFVEAGNLWGHSSAGSLLQGAGLFLWGIVHYFTAFKHAVYVVGLTLFCTGLLMNERRAAEQDPHNEMLEILQKVSSCPFTR